MFSGIALKANGTVFTWGNATQSLQWGSLGDGLTGVSSSPIQVLKGKDGDEISPVSNKYMETIVDVTVADSYARSAYAMFGALTEKGNIYIWGYDNVHPTGDSEQNISTPIKSKFQTELKAFSLGNADGIASQWIAGIGRDGKFYGGGYSAYGQAGTGATATTAIKKGLDSLDGLLQIDTATWSHVSGGVRPDGTVVMWGLNNYGQLGDGSYTNAIYPATVGGLSNSILRLGGGTISDENSSKAIDKIPGIITLADNEKLQIDKLKIKKSSGFNLISISDPVNVGSLEFKSMDESIATVNGDGVVKPNNNKRYGSTKIIIKDSESGWQTMIVVKIKPAGTVAMPKIAIGSNHTVALKSDGTVWTWGRNNYGQLGNGTKINSTRPRG